MAEHVGPALHSAGDGQAGKVRVLRRSGFPALRAVPKISKTLVAYRLAIVAPFRSGVADRRVPGLAEAHADAVLSVLKPLRLKSEDYVAYLACRLAEWYRDDPKGCRRAPP